MQMHTLEELSQEIELIKERNRRVEIDKNWEISWTRRLLIAAITYLTAAVWLVLIGDSYPVMKAFVPAVGYILSTLSVPFCKKMWTERQLKARKPTLMSPPYEGGDGEIS